jgi:hypothetical protein
MRQCKEDEDQLKIMRLFASRHRCRAITLIAAVASLAFASSASATPPTPPFNQCPGVGFDTSCEILIVINQQGGVESYVDPTQRSYEGANDYLVGVQNSSSATVPSITLRGSDLFGFNGDGLCSGENQTEEEGFVAPPAGCPFGPTGYEGPNTSFSNYKVEDAERNADEGAVNFLGGALEPGNSAYFSLESLPEVRCSETACEPTGLSTDLSGGTQSGNAITVPDGTAVTDTATLSGSNAGIATGAVHYRIYSDAACTNLVDEAGNMVVAGQTAPASSPETLPPGTYYWRVSYTGDSHNGGSQSACGSEVETVTPPPTCSKLAGAGHVGAKSLRQAVSNKLNTTLLGKQKFSFSWNHGEHSVRLTHLNSASCVVKGGEQKFSGQGLASQRKEKGYEMSFSITAVGGQTYLSVTVEKGHAVVAEFVHEQLILSKRNPEIIS